MSDIIKKIISDKPVHNGCAVTRVQNSVFEHPLKDQLSADIDLFAVHLSGRLLSTDIKVKVDDSE